MLAQLKPCPGAHNPILLLECSWRGERNDSRTDPCNRDFRSRQLALSRFGKELNLILVPALSEAATAAGKSVPEFAVLIISDCPPHQYFPTRDRYQPADHRQTDSMPRKPLIITRTATVFLPRRGHHREQAAINGSAADVSGTEQSRACTVTTILSTP